jgi:sucrose-6-phosphate hydrolase SacC (GH32 family)
MVMPRILSIGPDGALRQQVAPEFEALRGPVRAFSDLSLGSGLLTLDGVPGDAVEIEAEFAVTGFASFGFELRPSPSEAASTTISLQRGSLTVGRARAYTGSATSAHHLAVHRRRCASCRCAPGR